ncbi:potassium transporter TrkA [Sulfurimonas hongkongensis]|uniref:Potassium transporter TrkA n=1 Tax=Sulfurimonas hongkongensis TaxID=1172190 RepID=T0JRQ0_9BACT|nr:TrkA C-terminal domain-containing protein [Sulfurimonas hongkongensis]EQB40711.1 potassium transporter TrkA [Sulfurimonas hongkongensis]
MAFSNALIFGVNEYTLEIEKNISSHYKNVYIFELAKDVENGFDLSDNWDDLNKKVDINDSVAFCILEDMAENIFLTISLRDTFKDLVIVALAQNKESSDKLKLAGASRVLPTTQTTANVIVEMLEKPIVTEVLHNILYEKSSLQIAQIKIGQNSSFAGMHPADVEWSSTHGIIVISIVHEDMSRDFIYSSKAKHHQIKSGDIFVVVGYERDIKEFEKLIGADE